MTVLYTTHYMDEAQELSHRIGIMDHGKMIADGTHDELVKIVGEGARSPPAWTTTSTAWPSAGARCRASTRSTSEEDEAVLLTEDAHEVLPRLFETAAAAGSRIIEINVAEPNLEMVFLHLTGRALRD